METIYAHFSATKTTITSSEWNGRDSDELCDHNTVQRTGYKEFMARFYVLDHTKKLSANSQFEDKYFKQVAEIEIEPSDELLKIIVPLFRGGYTGFYYNFGEDDKWYIQYAATDPEPLDNPRLSWDENQNTMLDELRAIWHEDLHKKKIKPKTWDEIY